MQKTIIRITDKEPIEDRRLHQYEINDLIESLTRKEERGIIGQLGINALKLS